jgi:hypothetical protein
MTKSSSKDDIFNRGPGVRAMRSIYSDNVDDLPSGSDDSDLEVVGPVLRRSRGRPVSKQKDSGKDSGKDALGEQYSRTGGAKRKRSKKDESLSVFARQGCEFGNELDVDGNADDDIIFVDEVRVDKARRTLRVEKTLEHNSHIVEDEDEDNDEILRRIKLTVEAALGATTAVDEKAIEQEVRKETERMSDQGASTLSHAVRGQDADNSRQEKVLSGKQHANATGVIVLKFVFKRESKTEKVRLRRSDRIVAKVARPLCAVFGLQPENARFTLNGKALSIDATADLLHLDNQTLIEVDDIHPKSIDTADQSNGRSTEAVVVIKVRFIDGTNLKPIAVRIRRSDPIVKIRESVCSRANHDPRHVVFFLDGEVISDKDTPDSLDVEDNTLIDAEISLASA